MLHSIQYLQDLDLTIQNIVHAEKLQGCSILVTGATGTIGSFVVDTLLRMNEVQNAGMNIIIAGRDVQKLSKRFPHAQKNGGCFVPYDFTRPIVFDLPVDYIIHSAGNATPGAFNGDPVGTIISNIHGTYQLLEYGRMHETKRFVYVSSGEVYGLGDVTLEAMEESYSGPLDPTSPRSCYPSSKRTAETLCASYTKQFGLETIIVRPSHTYGAGMTAVDDRAHAQFFRNAIHGQDIVLKSAGTQMRSYTYVSDCVSGLLTAMLNGEAGQAYNLANPAARVTIAQLAQCIAQTAGQKVIFELPSDDDIKNRSPIAKQVLSTDKLEALGWTGAFDVATGVTHVLTILKQTSGAIA